MAFSGATLAARLLQRVVGWHPLDATRTAMEALAATLPPKELNAKAFHLYDQFRPEVPPEEAGWGAKGLLNLDVIKELSGT